jgi:hypothetical protein
MAFLVGVVALPPHPNPLPQGEGVRFVRPQISGCCGVSEGCRCFPLSFGERAGVRENRITARQHGYGFTEAFHWVRQPPGAPGGSRPTLDQPDHQPIRPCRITECPSDLWEAGSLRAAEHSFAHRPAVDHAAVASQTLQRPLRLSFPRPVFAGSPDRGTTR